MAVVVAASTSVGFASSFTVGSAGEAALGGGEPVFGKLAMESVGELVDCANGGVEFEPVD